MVACMWSWRIKTASWACGSIPVLRELLEQLRWDKEHLRRVLGNVPPRAAFGAVGWMAVEGTLGFCTERTASLVGWRR